MIMLFLGVLGWLVSAVAGIWFFMTVRELRDEIRLIRRYLQAMHDKRER